MSSFREIKDASLRPSEAVSKNETHGGHIVNGRTVSYKTGTGPAWNGGLMAATPIQHTDGKNDGKDIGRGKIITY